MIEPEIAHAFVKKASPLVPKGIVTQLMRPRSPALRCSLGSAKLLSPIGMAAGFDKNGELVDLMEALGFGFVEIGSVTSLPCKGNPKPRIFRLPADQSLINRMGLPNLGAFDVSRRLKKKKYKIPVGINVAKTPDFALAPSHKKVSGIDDMVTCYEKLRGVGKYVVLNLSCPNTEDGRTFESPEIFTDLARAMAGVRKKNNDKRPILVKLSPELQVKDLNRLIETANRYHFDGFVITNTTSERCGLKTSKRQIEKLGRGGLSGRALTELANTQLKRVYRIVGKEKILIGVGGIINFQDLVTKIAFGAQLFQIYTGLIYQGPLFVSRLNRKLDALCQKAGVKNYLELVGSKDILKMV